MEFPFVGGGYWDYSLNLNSQISQNLYPETDKEGGKSVLSLYSLPGMTLWINIGSWLPRGSMRMAGTLTFREV